MRKTYGMAYCVIMVFGALTWSLLPRAASAMDGLNSLAPLDGPALGSVTVRGSLLNLQDVSSKASISGNTISAGGGQIVNGAIRNNQISNNNGVTSVMMNTGNNVNFQNSMIVNVFAR